MPISGRSFQLNIASSLSFQLRTGFAAVRHAPNPENRLEQRQAETANELRENATDAEWDRQSPFYEAVGPYAAAASTTPQKAGPAAMTALPPHSNNKVALKPAEPASGNYYPAALPQRSTQERREFAEGQPAYTHSYRRNGQRVFMMTQTPAVDFFV